MNRSNKCKLCFLILIGLPGSGKTTFSSYLVQNVENSDATNIPFHCVIQVCYDEIITPNSTQWNKTRRVVARSIQDIVEKLMSCTDLELFAKQHNLKLIVSKKVYSTGPKILIVIDDNMYYRSMRYQYYQIARTHQVSFCQLYFKCPVQECLKRNSQRNIENQVADYIILKMAENLEKPNSNEHSWETYSTSIISDEPFSHISLESLYKVVSDAFSHPVQSALQNTDEIHPQTVSLNIVHEADLMLRKIIGNTIKEKKQTLHQNQIRELSTNLNTKKQTILQRMRLGKICIPKEITEGFEEGNPIAISALHSVLAEQFIEELHVDT